MTLSKPPAVLAAAALLSAAIWAAGCAGPGSVDDGNINGNSNGSTNVNDNDNGNTNDNDNAAEFVPGERLSSFRTDAFQGAGNCTVCHSGLRGAAGEDLSIGTAWRSTMMANAARDPFFLASVAAEVEEAPEALREVIENTCATCHMPMAHTQAVADGAASLMLEDGFLDAAHPLHEAAMEGVSCTLCHQIQPDDLGSSPSFSGGYRIDTAAQAPDRPIFGPYTDPIVELMQVSVEYTPAFGEHLTRSDLCATCHTLFTPVLNDAGEIVGEFPEQVPFLEWQHSVFGDGSGPLTHCQDCHMPVADGAVTISTLPANLEPRSPFYQHLFRGGNHFMLKLLREHIEPLGLTASSDEFDATIADTLAYLREDTADLEILEAGISGNTLRAELRVTVKTGHKFPTSFPSRRAWLHVTVTDAAGTTVFESGRPQDDGRIAGNAADESAAAFEDHYQTIRSNDEVQIYEAILADVNGDVTYQLLRAATYAKDNRLLPEGFDKSAADADVAVHGAAAGDDDFRGGSDDIVYEIAIDDRTGPFTLSAELLYHSVSYGFVRVLGGHESNLVDSFVEQYEAADHTPALIDDARRDEIQRP